MRSSRENGADGDVIANDVKIAHVVSLIEARKVSWFIIIIIDRFCIALFFALEQTHCVRV